MAQQQPSRSQLVALAAQDAQKYGLGPWFSKQISQESGFNPDATSGAGAEGIAQIVPKWHPGVDPYNPVQALDYAARYDKQLVDKYGGDVAAALSVYNSGSPTAYKDPSFAGGQTSRYVQDILGSATPPSGGQLARAAASPQTPAGDVATPSIQPPKDFFAGSRSALANSAGSLDKTAFYSALGDALRARATADEQQPTFSPLPAPAAATVPAQPLPGSSKLALAAVPLTLATRKGIDVDQQILPAVENVAKQFGVQVNSGYRSPQHNAQVGGAEHSDHLTGDAVDFTGSPQQMAALQAWALRQKFPYVEPTSQTHGSHVHISFRR